MEGGAVSETGFERIVMEQLHTLAEGHKQLLEGVGEVKGEIVALQSTASQQLTEAKRTNGRVSALETWRQAVAVTDAADKGRLEGAATAAVTKGQLRALGVVATAIATLSGAIVGIVVKLL